MVRSNMKEKAKKAFPWNHRNRFLFVAAAQ
jgi:hypothetical protein